MTLGERFVDLVLRFRWAAIALVATITVACGVGALRVGVDNSVEVWFVDDDPTLAAYHRFQETFGNDEVVAVAVHREAGVLDREGLALVAAVTDAATKVEGVARVTSLTTVDDVRSYTDADGVDVLDVGNLVRNGEVDAARVLADPLLVGRLVSEDGKTALVVVQMKRMEGFDQARHKVLVDLEQAVKPLVGEYRTAGIGVVYDALNQLSTVDSAIFVVLSYTLIVGVLWILLGRVGAMLVAMASVGVAAVWLMGAYGFAGRDINMVTMILPTLVLIIGVSDCVHVMNHVAELAEGWTKSRRELVVEAAGFVFAPCLFNTVTTVVGFASLATAPMAVLRDMGVFAAIGLSGAFLVAMVLCPIALMHPAVQPLLTNRGKLQRVVDACADLALSRPLAVLAVTAAIALASALGISRIRADTYSIDYLRPSHDVRQDSDWIEANLGYYTPLELVVRPAAGRADDPALLAAVDAWERRMEQHPRVGWATSVADVAKRLNRELSADRKEVVPSDPAAVEQSFLLYTASPEVDLSQQVEGDWAALRVTVGIPMVSAGEMGRLTDELVAMAQLPEGAKVEVTGYIPLYVRMMRYIVQSQLSSFGLAFVVIFGIIAALFRSVRLAALAVPANLVPILVTLGVMGYAGIRLDVATVTIGAIVLGLVVDDTVQFLYRFQHELKKRGDAVEAASVTVRGLGRSLVVTALVLALGFSVLAFAEIRSVSYFGLLVALALGTGVFGDLLVLPALLVLTARPAPVTDPASAS
ncbi:MAG: efflux RND transporter permease subunit [Myxococcota bacterium]